MIHHATARTGSLNVVRAGACPKHAISKMAKDASGEDAVSSHFVRPGGLEGPGRGGLLRKATRLLGCPCQRLSIETTPPTVASCP